MATPNDLPTTASAADLAREDARIDDIVARGPAGTFAVVGVATFIVVAIVFLFYFLVFLPRGAIQ
ncbi:MAG TPA: hypothetical protein VLJ19_21145 [Variovorax sp.]|nr:hypothetical protein [Variovorax sp.]